MFLWHTSAFLLIFVSLILTFRHCILHSPSFTSRRWDIQRIREQRMFQRLQQRMNKRKGIQESEPEVFSFYPEAEDGKPTYTLNC